VGDRLHVYLDLDRDGEPVSGHVGLVDGERWRFTGYADLIAKLQAIRAEDAAADGGAAEVGTS
jgi:hypothetical protein